MGGREHYQALKADGTVAARGADRYGQASVPPGLGNVVAVAAGEYHSLALRADGAVVAWGAGGTLVWPVTVLAIWFSPQATTVPSVFRATL